MTLDVWLLTIARAGLALVFLSAGVLKLTSATSFRKTFEDFGFQPNVARSFAPILPWAEVVVAFAMVWPATTLAGAIVALLFLAAFTVTILSALRRGETPPCNCFGAVTPSPISRTSVWRNAGLILTAAVIVALAWRDPGPSLVAWAGTAVAGGLVLACACLGIALVGTTRTLQRAVHVQREQEASIAALEAASDQRARAMAAVKAAPTDDSLPVGAGAPSFSSRDTRGQNAGLAALLAGQRPLLLFSAGINCGACRALAPKIREWADVHRDRLTIAVIHVDGPAASGEFGDRVIVLAEKGPAIAKGYRLHWTPGAVVVDVDGRIASPVAFGADAIEKLVRTVVATSETESTALAAALAPNGPGLTIGATAEGVPRGEQEGALALLFWKSSCPHCQAVEPEVRKWVAAPIAARGPSGLIVVNWSDAPVAGLDGVPIINDSDGELARRFGVRGTPSALLIDAGGRVASTVGVGGSNVLALLGERSAAPA